MAPELKRETDAILWRTESHTLVIECPRGLLDEIHLNVLDGFRRLSHGGIEVGGVLFGLLEDKLLRIVAWRPILCEYAGGPGFTLSEADRAGLRQLLETAREDPQLQVLEPIGWFVSHTRKGVELLDRDVEIYDTFFAEPWHVTLVVHPEKTGPSRAGFFFREEGGTIRRSSSYKEFPIEQTFRVRPHSSARPEAHEIPESQPGSDLIPGHTIDTPETQQAKVPRPWREWGIVVAGLFLLAVAGVAVPRFRAAYDGPDESLGLRLQDLGGQLRVEWNRNSKALLDAEKAELQIVDGGALQVSLQPEIARSGSLTYGRRSDDVTIRFIVFRKNKPPAEELARYVGPPVAPPVSKSLVEAQKERDGFLVEAEKLREELKRESQRTRDLERAVRQLKSKMERNSRRK